MYMYVCVYIYMEGQRVLGDLFCYFIYLTFLLNLLGWHWLTKSQGFRCTVLYHIICTLWACSPPRVICLWHSYSPFTPFYLSQAPFNPSEREPLATILLFVSMRYLFFLIPYFAILKKEKKGIKIVISLGYMSKRGLLALGNVLVAYWLFSVECSRNLSAAYTWRVDIIVAGSCVQGLALDATCEKSRWQMKNHQVGFWLQELTLFSVNRKCWQTHCPSPPDHAYVGISEFLVPR